MSTNINSTEQIVEINAGDQITNVNIVSQSTTQVISGEQVVTVDVNAGTIPAAWGSITGTLSNQTDLQNALNAKQNNITLTTTGTTGLATLVGSTLNIPNYVSSTKQSQWDSAYNDKINSAEVSGTTTKTLTLTQQDGGIIQASWSDFDTAPVTSVFGRTGDVVAAEGDYNINQLGDVTITSATNGQVLKYNGTAWVNAADASGLTSVGLAMPSAFTVSGSPLTSNGTITVTGAGTTAQYVRGDGSLATFPTTSQEAYRLISEVYNQTGATLTKGTIVYINGAHGNLPTVTKAIATGDSTSAQTFGFVQSDITNNNNGFIVIAGKLTGLDTQGITEGAQLYLSPSVAGGYTTTKQYAPNHLVYVGIVNRAHPTQGEIEVKIQNGYELDEIHNVSARFPVNKDGLFYNSTSGVWENKSIAGILGYTPVPESRIITINGTAQNLSADRTWNVGTVTQVAASGGTGISVAGSPVTGSGTITITNTAPDQVVGLTGAGTTSISGTYPNFTITSNDQYTGTVTSVAASGGTGISISGSPITSSGTINITNTAPDQIVSLTGAGTTSISGTYPNFTVTSNDQYVGTVTSVNATVPTGFEVSGVPITSSGTVDIKFASGYSLPTNAKQTQWDDAYAKRINSLTVTGNSGSSTLVSNVLNVPTYTLSGLGGEPAITAGTTLQYFRGDKTFQTLNTSVVPESGNVYFTEPRVRATVLSGLNITGGSISASDSVLNAFGKVQNQINGLIGGSIFQSTWNASTNTPSLASGVGTKGYYYIVSVAGTTNLDGITDWQIGDWAIFDGTVWRKVDNTDAVVSVNGFTGTVSLGISNLADVSASSPTDTQLLRFNGTTSKWYNWTPTYISGNQTITLSGDVTGSGTTAITTSIGTGKVTNAMLAGSINYAKMDATTVPTWNQNTTGSAATLTTARNFTINGTSKSFNGSADVSWTAAEIGLTNYLPLTGGTLTGSGGVLFIEDTNTSSGSPTYGTLQVKRRTNIVDNGVGIAFGMYDSTNTMQEYGYLGYRINTATAATRTGLFALYVTSSGTDRKRIVEFRADRQEFLVAQDNDVATARRYYDYASNEYRFYGNNASGSNTAIKLMQYNGSAYEQVVTGSGEVDTIAYWETANKINRLSTGTYPSLTELSYVKGVTSAIQTQLNGKLSTSGGTISGTLSVGTSSAPSLGNSVRMAKGFEAYITEGAYPDRSYIIDSSGNGQLDFVSYPTGTNAYSNSIGIFKPANASGKDLLIMSGSANIRFVTGGYTEVMRVTNDNTLLIGRTSALGSEKLLINSGDAQTRITVNNTLTTGARQADIMFGHAGNVSLQIGTLFSYPSYDTQIWFRGLGTVPMTFRTNDIEVVRLTSDQEVLIGYTTDQGAYKLQVNGNIYAGGGGDLVLSPASSGGNATLYNDSGWFVSGNDFSVNGGLKVGAATQAQYTLDVVGGGVPLYVTSQSNATSDTYGMVQLYRQTSTNGNGVGIALNMQDSAGNLNEYAYIGAMISSNTNTAERGSFGIWVTKAGNTRSKAWAINADNITELYDVNGNGTGHGRTYYQLNVNEFRFYAINGSGATTGVKLMEYNGSDYYQVLTTNTGLALSGGTLSGALTVNSTITTNGNNRTQQAIGSGDDVRSGLGSYDTTAMGSGVGGQIVLGYKYTSAGDYTEGAIIKMYKENAVSGEYGSGLKFQVRNNGAALSTKMTLTPSGRLLLGSISENSAFHMRVNGAISSNITSGGTQDRCTITDSNGGTFNLDLVSYVSGSEAYSGSMGMFVRGGKDALIMAGDANIRFVTGGYTEVARATNGQEFLIGYTSDQGAYKLQVNGAVLASSFFESSDIRFKNVLTNTYSESFSAIQFNWKDKRDMKNHWGYAAQDVLKYIPDAVETNEDGYMTVNYNEAHTWKIAQLESEIKQLKNKLNELGR